MLKNTFQLKKLKGILFYLSIIVLVVACSKSPERNFTNIPNQGDEIMLAARLTVDSICSEFPTSDNTLNQNISDLVIILDSFDKRIDFIFQDLTSTEKPDFINFIDNQDTTVFNAYPQFDDSILKNLLPIIKSSYSGVLERYQNLYPNLSSNEVVEGVTPIIKCSYSQAKLAPMLEELSGNGNLCEKQRINCIAAVAAEALVMHVGCAAVDITVLAGIVCHAAAFTYQYTAGKNCNIAYEQCMKE